MAASNVVQILVAPGTTLAGVALGAWLQSRAAGARLSIERETAREGRLFEHRREAYETFLASAVRYYDAAWEHNHYPSGPDPDEDAFVPLWTESERVAIYGSKAAARLARELTKKIMDYGSGSYDGITHDSTPTQRAEADRTASDAILAATESFREVVRRDFGVD